MQHFSPHASTPLPAGLPGPSSNAGALPCSAVPAISARAIFVLCALLLVLLSSGCAKRKPKATVPVSTRPAMPSVIGATEEGIASWYGHPYHGRRTANGEIYDQEKMTAAHPSLKFHTWVEVRNLDNGLETTVRINDRGPFAKGRAIDLSRAAARAIAMLGPGTARVRVKVIAPITEHPNRPSPAPVAYPASPQAPAADAPSGSPSAAGAYAVQFGAFQNFDNALRLRDQVAAFLPDARVVTFSGTPPLWLVLGGSGLSREAAEQIVRDLREDFPRIFPIPAH
ncbi:MAG: septal ring lytic transglycosylase RlpA family protein [Bryobacterales bacterium]|nr:septal ring lytic transglycosylase RlpA family protein [Bryobacterales bacterium]